MQEQGTEQDAGDGWYIPSRRHGGGAVRCGAGAGSVSDTTIYLGRVFARSGLAEGRSVGRSVVVVQVSLGLLSSLRSVIPGRRRVNLSRGGFFRRSQKHHPEHHQKRRATS